MLSGKSLGVVVLAAGKGTRMKSDLPKVLHGLAGRPILAYVLDLAQALNARQTVVVVGHKAQMVKEAFPEKDGLQYALQEPQLGTGHAVMAAAPFLKGFIGNILVLYGDVPGLKKETVQSLLEKHESRSNKLTVLGMDLPQPGAYGRLLVGPDGNLCRIVEARDASGSEKKVTLVNSGIYVFDAQALLKYLPGLGTDNDQGEYYLTDLVEAFAGDGLQVGYDLCRDPLEVAGINSKDELAEFEKRFLSGS